MRGFIPNPGFIEELKRDSAYQDALEEKAEAVRAAAKPLTPRILPRQAEALEVQTDEDGVRVVNTDSGGHIAEWGSVKTPPHAPLRRGVQAAGLRLAEEPKS